MYSLKHILSKKNIVFVFLCFLAISLFQLLKFKTFISFYDIKVSLSDYMMFCLGGMERPISLLSILSWMSIIYICIYMSLLSPYSLSNLNIFTLNRLPNRLTLWVYICLSQLIVSIILFILLLVSCLIVGSIALGFNLNFSEYIKIFYTHWYQVGTIKMILTIFLVFTSGLYTLQMIIQVGLVFGKNKSYLFIGFLILLSITGILSIYLEIPRILTPLFYPSTLILDSLCVNNVILINFFISLVFIFVGYVVFINKNL